MRLYQLVILIIILIMALSVFTYFIMLGDYQEINMEVKVSDQIGINVNWTDLNFGTLSPGDSSNKKFYLRNDGDKNYKVNIVGSGEIIKWTTLSENNFDFKKGETKEIEAQINIPKDTKFGIYQGKLKIYFWKTI